MRDVASGLTLIEVLISIAIFAVVIAITSGILSSLTLNNASNNVLLINQESQKYTEVLTDRWRDETKFGLVDAAFPKPTNLTNYAWSVEVCQVDMSSFTCAAGKSATFSQTTTTMPTLTPDSSAKLMYLKVTYTNAGTGRSTVLDTEVYKR